MGVDVYVLYNEGNNVLCQLQSLRGVLIEACIIAYREWLNAAIDRWAKDIDAHENRHDLPANDMKGQPS
jgi:hypothetical protein